MLVIIRDRSIHWNDEGWGETNIEGKNHICMRIQIPLELNMSFCTVNEGVPMTAYTKISAMFLAYLRDLF